MRRFPSGKPGRFRKTPITLHKKWTVGSLRLLQTCDIITQKQG